MSEKNYSKRELDTALMSIKDHLGAQDIILNDIKTQTTKTNGRVSKLEWWKGGLIWAFGVLITLSIPIGILIKTIIKQQVQQSVSEVLDTYNIVIK